MARIEIIIVGIGGMGVILAGRILARAAAIYENKEVVQTQSYGAEARGTAAKSEIIIDDRKINYPKVRKCDILIAMSQDGLKKYLPYLKNNGNLIFEKSLIKNVPKMRKLKILGVPAVKIAEELIGKRMVANIVIISAAARFSKIVSENSLKKAIIDIVPEPVRNINLRAVEEGNRFLKSYLRNTTTVF